jgi:hypothetical protein
MLHLDIIALAWHNGINRIVGKVQTLPICHPRLKTLKVFKRFQIVFEPRSASDTGSNVVMP